MVSAMAKSIRPILSPLLSVSYVCGLRIVEFPAGNPRVWFSFLYILLLWPTYCFIITDKLLSYICNDSFEYRVYIFLNILMSLLSILLAVYHDKKFRNCLKKLAIVDDTLEKIGIMTNYQELNKKIIRIVLGWFVIALLLNCSDYIRWHHHYDALTSIYLTFMMNFSSHVNIINDLIFTSILGYIGSKFDYINEHLHKLTTETQASGSPVLQLHQRGLLNVPTSKYITWIIIHLHLELHRISLEINSIFEVEMTFKMVCYFGIIAEFLRQFFSTLFIRHFVAKKTILIIIIVTFWLAWYIARLFMINYICEKVSAKANATGDVINKISHFTCNMEIHENILQFFFQVTQAPLRFHGFRLFQFGLKFFYTYFESILALIILLIQADRFKHALKNDEICNNLK